MLPSLLVLQQVQVQPNPLSDLEDDLRWDPRLGNLTSFQQLPKLAGVDRIGLRPPLRTTPCRDLGGIRDMHLRPGRGAFLGDEPPAGAALHHHLHLTVELGQPLAEPDPVRRCDPTPLGLTRVEVDPVEGDLLPMNVEPSYDAHQDLLQLLQRNLHLVQIFL